MWKYISKEQEKEFLLSLNLIDNKLTDKEKIIKIYSISNNIKNNYKIYKIPKHNGKKRLIYEPSTTLKHIQRQILTNILENKSISEYAKAYCKGISLKKSALPHLNKKTVLKLDIKDFFNHINFIDIYNSCFPIEYFPKPIGILLTYLCTYENHLPQGAPTSAYISNLVLKEFDEKIGRLCFEKNISYTRYSDDMTFSGDFNPTDIIKVVKKELHKYKLEINKDKIHVIKKNNRQTVTGIVVNKKMQVSRDYRKKIRKEIYYIKKYGLPFHLNKIKYEGNPEKYLKSLYGKVLYVLQINKEDKEFNLYKRYLETLYG